MGCASVRFAFAVAGSRAARSLLFSRWFWGLLARARPQAQNAAIYGVLLLLRFRAGLRAVLFGLLFLRPLARHGITSKRRSRLQTTGPENKIGSLFVNPALRPAPAPSLHPFANAWWI